MQKVDLAIGILGFVALTATALGVVFADDIAGLQDYAFEESFVTIGSSADTPVGSNGVEFTFDLDDTPNATMGKFTFAFTENGRSQLTDGDASYTITITGPEGTMDTFEGSFSGNEDVVVDTSAWAETPETQGLTEANKDSLSFTWMEDVTITVSVDAPGSQIPLGGASPTYSVTVSGEALVFEAVPATPDVEVA